MIPDFIRIFCGFPAFLGNAGALLLVKSQANITAALS